MDEPILETHDIQGNIFPGFNKSHQVLLGVRFDAAAPARAWVRALSDEVATADEVWEFNQLRRDMVARRTREPAELLVTWVSVAFSAAGLAALGRADVSDFADEAF